MKTSEILRNAKALIDSPEKWTQRAAARNKFNIVCGEHCKDAVCFCSIGAISKATATLDVYEFQDARRYLSNYAKKHLCTSASLGAVEFFNDHRGHGDVMDMFDAAIEAAERDQK